jgi:hypothetical protein
VIGWIVKGNNGQKNVKTNAASKNEHVKLYATKKGLPTSINDAPIDRAGARLMGNARYWTKHILEHAPKVYVHLTVQLKYNKGTRGSP